MHRSDWCDLTGTGRVCELHCASRHHHLQHASQCVVATGFESDGASPRTPDRQRDSDADPRLGSPPAIRRAPVRRRLFSTPPSILDSLEGGPELDSMWIVDEARHLLDTFGGRAIGDWARCGSDGCDDVRCICHFVRDGINHYGEWADPIATILMSVARMADDEAMEDAESTAPTELVRCHNPECVYGCDACRPGWCCRACDRDGVCERL